MTKWYNRDWNSNRLELDITYDRSGFLPGRSLIYVNCTGDNMFGSERITIAKNHNLVLKVNCYYANYTKK
ncbi:MAG: hypothetical protein GDA43_12145 [Hormoscilla sp. SP5CHS1]|nr:hypothetical protein [Hormoscilla sp. SP12CHS1]MBC6453858.1 hypothetical protein [Hormoscilla sp. SP5CHS1]MBC6472204.1 hypothetical protein [Hormoscilla sp. GM102CHS1]